MLAEIFVSVLIMSAIGSLFILFLFAVKPLTERFFGVRCQFYIWLSALIVLICPLKIKTDLKLPQTVSQTISIVSAKPAFEISVFEDYSGVYMSQAVQTDGGTKGFEIVAAVWLVAAVALLIKTVVLNMVFKNHLYKNSVYGHNFGKAEIRVSDKVAAPILVGGLRAALYIPKKVYNTDKMQYITAHEGVHIRRNDIGIKWFATAVKCIHWFNPLVYYLVRQLNEACEVSCDAMAVNNMCDRQKREYMQTILEISQNEANFKGFLAAGLSSGGKCLKRRFSVIGKGDRTSPPIRVAGIVVTMIITFCLVCACGIIIGSAQYDGQTIERVLVAPKKTLPETEDVVPEIEKPVMEDDTIPTETLETELVPKPKDEHEKTPSVVGEFNSEGGDTRIISDIKPDESGCIRLGIRSNAQEVIDVFVNDGESGREVHSFSIPVSHSASYVIDGLEKEKTYDVVLRGTMRNNWKIESEYIIY